MPLYDLLTTQQCHKIGPTEKDVINNMPCNVSNIAFTYYNKT